VTGANTLDEQPGAGNLLKAATAAVDLSNPGDALSDLTRLAVELLNADRAALYISDENGTGFFPRCSHNVDLAQLGHLPSIHKHPLLITVMETKQATANDSGTGSLGLPLAPGEIACSPCVSWGEVVGMLFIARDNKKSFDDETLAILQVLSGRAAEAINFDRQTSDQTHLFHRLTLLYQASHAIAKTQDKQETIRHLATHLLKATGADVCEVMTLEGGSPQVSRFQQKLVKGAIHTLPAPQAEDMPDYPAHSKVLDDQKSTILSVKPPVGSAKDIALLKSEGYLMAAVLPLTTHEKAAGLVRLLYSTKGREIGPHELELAQAVINIGAMGLQDAIHLEISQSHANQLQVLSEIGREMTSTLDLEGALQSAMRHAQRLVQAESVILFLLDEKHERLVLKASGGSDMRVKDAAIPLEDGIAGWVTRNKAPLIVNDVSSDPHYMSAIDGQTGMLTTSVICVPLEEHGQVLGVIEAINHPMGAFTDSDAQVLAAVASWAAIALDKARLFRRVAEERRRLEATLVETADAVVLTDPDGKIILVNKAAAKAFDIDPEKAAGLSADRIFDGNPLGELLVSEDVDLPMRLEITTPRERVLYASLSEVSEVGRVAVMQDITPLKQIDRMRSQLLGTAAHDLKNPLNAIRLGADLLHDAPLTDQQRKALHMMQRATDSMTTLITSLLEMIRVESSTNLEVEPCFVQDLVRSSIEELRPLSEARSQEIIFELPEEPLRVMGVPPRLNSVMTNLLSNAIKFTDPGGRINMALEWSDDEVIVRVSDNGPGICDEELPLVFDHFFRGRAVIRDPSNPVEGTGLGLALAKTVVEQHGGKIWVESTEGKGSTFSFSLPRDKDPDSEKKS
jgi:signal transduction histidine kinase